MAANALIAFLKKTFTARKPIATDEDDALRAREEAQGKTDTYSRLRGL